jgi:hypothetical protein
MGPAIVVAAFELRNDGGNAGRRTATRAGLRYRGAVPAVACRSAYGVDRGSSLPASI